MLRPAERDRRLIRDCSDAAQRRRERIQRLPAHSDREYGAGQQLPRHLELVHGPRFGASAQLWLGLQMDWDLYHAVHSAAAKEINKIKRRPL